MSDVAGWLAAREPQPPAALRAAMARAMTGVDESAATADALAEAALGALRQALASGDDRAAAWPLLTADALLTYALEAAAEQGMDTLVAVAERWDAGAFAALLGEETP